MFGLRKPHPPKLQTPTVQDLSEARAQADTALREAQALLRAAQKRRCALLTLIHLRQQKGSSCPGSQ